MTRRRFSHALMSDTKWWKLFDAVSESDWQPSLVNVSFVDCLRDLSEPTLMSWPNSDRFWGPPPWVDTPEFGPIELRSIEWLLIPPVVVTGPYLMDRERAGLPQNFVAIQQALSRVGQFPLEETSEGLRIIGYR